MKKKFLIILFMIMIMFSFCTVNVLATDSLLATALNQIDANKGGVTETRVTIWVRTIYAIVQMVAVGGSLIYFTWHSTRFFSGDATVRSRAKDALPYRVLAIVIIFSIDGLVAICLKYFNLI